MATLTDFLPYVLPYVTGCSTPLAELHIRQCAIDFCTHASVVQTMLDPIDVVMNQREYDLDCPPGTEKTFIQQAWFDGKPLAISHEPSGQVFLPDTPAGTPSLLIENPDNRIVLNRPPWRDFPQGLLIQVATKPTRNTAMVADVLFNDYPMAIGYGTVAQLMRIPGHAFSNPAQSAQYTFLYERERTNARIRASKGFAAGSSRVQPRPFR